MKKGAAVDERDGLRGAAAVEAEAIGEEEADAADARRRRVCGLLALLVHKYKY